MPPSTLVSDVRASESLLNPELGEAVVLAVSAPDEARLLAAASLVERLTPRRELALTPDWFCYSEQDPEYRFSAEASRVLLQVLAWASPVVDTRDAVAFVRGRTTS